MRCLGEVKAENAFTKYHDIHINWLEKVIAVVVLVERPIVNKVIMSEELDLLASLLKHNILCGKWVNAKSFRYDLHLRLRGAEDIKPPDWSFSVPDSPFLWFACSILRNVNTFIGRLPSSRCSTSRFAS
jgi:hypothetical protein